VSRGPGRGKRLGVRLANRSIFLENPGRADSPMKKPGGVHIMNGPVFSAYTNRWGGDCSCGWKTSHQFHGFVDGAVTQHRRVAAGFRTKRRRERARDEKRANMKTCPACTEKGPAAALWCMFCGFRFDSAEAAPDI